MRLPANRTKTFNREFFCSHGGGVSGPSDAERWSERGRYDMVPREAAYSQTDSPAVGWLVVASKLGESAIVVLPRRAEVPASRADRQDTRPILSAIARPYKELCCEIDHQLIVFGTLVLDNATLLGRFRLRWRR